MAEAALDAGLAAPLRGVASTTTRLRGSAFSALSALADLLTVRPLGSGLPRVAARAGVSSSSSRAARAAAGELGRTISTRLWPATSLLPDSLFHDCTWRGETP
ncbi:hypothetical protein D3C86_1240440 [compost metagenome]